MCEKKDETYCGYDIVFQGKAVVAHLEDAHPRERRTYVVEVDRIFWSKISSVGTILDLNTAKEGNRCGAKFQLNTPYVIAANEVEKGGLLSTGLCSGNKRWNRLHVNRQMFFTDRLQKLCAPHKHLD
ncbi:uncharacterized protein LOC112559840 [Pomacea canaliculata]|uniref:uncharacterized protein LOC112559840 n=1 Tax=Pomacea canaliculata TaxID=400727 RepID=UPI000D736306|nr:uncharacterized protein LOC112559840 [Pomacea canaliculata]